MNEVFAHSCESMNELEDNTVSLTVTSPPYWNAIDYDIHASNKEQNYRTRAYGNGYTEYGHYLEWLEKIFAEVLRVTKPGGFCGIVIGTVLLNGKHYPVPFDLIPRMIQKGWEFHQDIIWHKCTGGVKRAGVTIQKPFPGYFYPNIMTEYILLFRKSGPPIYQNRSAHQKKEAEYPINRLFTMDIANNIWHIAPIPPDQLDHPCPFPEEIPYRLVTMYSYPGEIVLDPFTGSGQTLKVAHWLKRDYVGYEIIPKYVELTKQRIKEPLSIRPKQLIAIFEKVGLNDLTLNQGNSLAESKSKQQETPLAQARLLDKKAKYRNKGR